MPSRRRHPGGTAWTCVRDWAIMRNRLDEAKSDLIAKAAAVADRSHQSADDEAYLRRYYRHVAPDDVIDRDPVDVYGAAASPRQLAAVRPQGTSAVRVFTPTVDEHGWSSGHTVVEVVTDDMPFLVDSVTMALSRLDRAVHLVIHPQLVVERDVTGKLVHIRDLDASDPQVAESAALIVESWMHVEIGLETDDDELRSIDDDMQSVLLVGLEAVKNRPQ